MTNAGKWNAALFAATAMIGLGVAAGAASAQAPDAKTGREIYTQKGCWGCHGFNGQGAVTGPNIAPDPMPLEALITYLRNASATLMPPYDAKGLSDAEVAHIHAWLASQPKAADWKTIPLLKQ